MKNNPCNKSISEEKTDHSLEIFIKSCDINAHKEAISNILDDFGYREKYLDLLESNDATLPEILIKFHQTLLAQTESSPSDFKTASQLNKKIKNYLKRHEYSKIISHTLALAVFLLKDILELDEESSKMTVADFLEKHVPEELYMQYLLLENMSCSKYFNWKRDKQIIYQNLILAGLCFQTIVDHVQESGTD